MAIDGSHEEIAFFREFFQQAGIPEKAYRRAPLLRRLPACLRALRTPDVISARELLRHNPAALAVVMNALLIGTTGFFRDPAVFSSLQDQVIPALCSRVAHPAIWSAACSDGSELCSVAMLVAAQGALERSRFLGTDCRAAAIESARRGCYPADAAGAADPVLTDACFTMDGAMLRVRPAFAERMSWECGDVFRDGNPGQWDMILCRNLAIYLAPGSMAALWQRLEAALRPGGILVVGRAEKPPPSGLRRIAPCIYQTPLRTEFHD